MTTTIDDIEANAITAFKTAPVTVEDLARAWASIDGKAREFDEGKGLSVSEDRTGHYAGYCHEALELLQRATSYAIKRKLQRTAEQLNYVSAQQNYAKRHENVTKTQDADETNGTS